MYTCIVKLRYKSGPNAVLTVKISSEAERRALFGRSVWTPASCCDRYYNETTEAFWYLLSSLWRQWPTRPRGSPRGSCSSTPQCPVHLYCTHCTMHCGGEGSVKLVAGVAGINQSVSVLYFLFLSLSLYYLFLKDWINFTLQDEFFGKNNGWNHLPFHLNAWI